MSLKIVPAAHNIPLVEQNLQTGWLILHGSLEITAPLNIKQKQTPAVALLLQQEIRPAQELKIAPHLIHALVMMCQMVLTFFGQVGLVG
jgi:hypothetical protein